MIKRAVEPPSGVVFNSVLLNRYRTGKDSVNWHADDKPGFGERPVIASVSFGGTRAFQLRHKERKELKASVELTHGSLLVMRGGTQANWVHQVPKTTRPVEERLNLTFRSIVAQPSRRHPASGIMNGPHRDLVILGLMPKQRQLSHSKENFNRLSQSSDEVRLANRSYEEQTKWLLRPTPSLGVIPRKC